MTMRSVAQSGYVPVGESSGVRQAKLAFGCFAALLLGLIGVFAQNGFDRRSSAGDSVPAAIPAGPEPQRPQTGVVRASFSPPPGITVVTKTETARTAETTSQGVTDQQAARTYDSVARATLPATNGVRDASAEAGHASSIVREARQEPSPGLQGRDRTAAGQVVSGQVASGQVASGEAAPGQAAAEPTVALAVPRTVRVLGPLTFTVGSTHYRLQSADGLGVSACSTRRGGRCFRRPRGDLKEAIAGATLQCRTLDKRAGEVLVACSKGALSSLP